MKKTGKMPAKTYTPWSFFDTFVIVGGIVFGYVLTFSLIAFFVKRFLIDSYDPTVFALIAFLLIAPTFLAIEMHRERFLRRFFLQYRFSEKGIACQGIGWGRFFIAWQAIRTYGVFGSTPNRGFLFFSLDPKELVMENMLILRKDRLILEYRQDAWEAAFAYMPADMKKRLEDALSHNYQGFFKR